MSYDKLSDIRAEILARPRMSILFEDLLTNKVGKLITLCVQRAQIEFYESRRLVLPSDEGIAQITLPAGVAFGANSKKYVLNSGSTPALTSGLGRLKKLWILGDAAAKYDTKSTFDSDDAEGSGIPDDGTAIGVNDVYHEMIGEGDDQELELVVGTTAAGAAPKVGFTYSKELVLVSADSDTVDIAFNLFQTDFMQKVNNNLKNYIGFDGF